ncbi:hypothetical protein, partial [Lactiplantibacillus pentosus]
DSIAVVGFPVIIVARLTGSPSSARTRFGNIAVVARFVHWTFSVASAGFSSPEHVSAMNQTAI